MNSLVFEQLVQESFVRSEELIEKQNRFSYPFRDRFKHTRRVLKWAQRIYEIEGGDIEIITLAVIFHDTGWDDVRDHALIGAELARKFLIEQGVKPEIVSRVESAIETHNKRENLQTALPIENLIVMDADRLDELGVTTLVWDAMATALDDDPGFKKVLEKSQIFFEKAKNEANLIHTKTGKKFYDERIEFWGKCLNQFRYELGESDLI